MITLLEENFTSKNLFEKLSALDDHQKFTLADGLGWTLSNCPDAVIIGGTAVVHYLKSGRGLTPDLDFLVPDLSLLKQSLDEFNINYRSIRSDKGEIGITVPDFNTDYLSVDAGNKSINKMALRIYSETMIFGKSVRMIIPELLTIMKLDLGRDKDTDDALSLISSGVLDKGTFIKLVDALQKHLGDLKTIMGFEKMIK